MIQLNNIQVIRLNKWVNVKDDSVINTTDNIKPGETYTEHGTITLKFGSCDCILTKIDVDNWTLEIGEGVGEVVANSYGPFLISYSYPWYWKCGVLTSITVTGKVSFEPNTKLTFMFRNCVNCKIIKGLNNFDTSNVISITAMFSGCSQVKELDVSNWNTSNVTDIAYSFYNCSQVKYIKINNNLTVNNYIELTDSRIKEL